jgi:hypothetical protein
MEERKKIAETGAYNDDLMQIAHSQGRVTEDEWTKYQKGSLAQKSGIATAHAASMAADFKRQKTEMQNALDAERILALQRQDQPLNLSPQEIETGTSVGKRPLRTSERSFVWAEDPNNPVNWGGEKGTPIDKFGRPVDPNNPKSEPFGLQQPNGVVKWFPRKTTIQELREAGLIKSPNDTQPTPTPTPTSVNKVMTQADFDALPSGTVFIAPDGSRRRKP